MEYPKKFWIHQLN